MYHESIFRAQYSTISINDALALVIMEQKKIDEIHTFDRHFDQVGVRVVQE
jgi:predicted nucleic acid-binding protein